MKQVFEVSDGPSVHAFLSPVIRAGDFVFAEGNAGLLPGRPPSGADSNWRPGELVEGGIEAETRQTLKSIRISLEAAGAGLDQVVNVNAFLRDVDRDFHAYSEVYLEFFPSELPTRTTVGAKIYGLILVEIECVAYAPEH
jgi:2-iminobutanoate/2-iminopropanoate deaminase